MFSLRSFSIASNGLKQDAVHFMEIDYEQTHDENEPAAGN